MSLPQRFFASARRPSYRSQTATNFTPGTVRHVIASATPIPPEPINAICTWSFALNSCCDRINSSRCRWRSLAVITEGIIAAPITPLVTCAIKERLEFSGLIFDITVLLNFINDTLQLHWVKKESPDYDYK